MNKIKYPLLFFIILSLLTACGSKNQASPTTKSANGTVSDVSGAASDVQNRVPSIHDQVGTIMKHEDMWHKEDSRTNKSADDTYIEGPFYSLMDLDQDGYLEIVVTAETDHSCPSYYEVTEDESLRKWTVAGDLPNAKSEFSIFEITSKADCYYDKSCDQYHYIVMDKLALSQDDADITYLDMIPDDSGVTFRKIGRCTFDASIDNKHHYFNVKGAECSENDLTNAYSGMTKKTLYFSKTPFSKKTASEVWASDMEDSQWKKFILRDDYRSEKENELTDELRHQFVSHSIQMSEYVADMNNGDETDQIRYAATDLDNNQYTEIIIENITKQTFCIYEESDDEDYPEPDKWKTKGKKLTDFTKDNPSISWQTCAISDISDMSDDLIEDNLRESWLHFKTEEMN